MVTIIIHKHRTHTQNGITRYFLSAFIFLIFVVAHAIARPLSLSLHTVFVLLLYYARPFSLSHSNRIHNEEAHTMLLLLLMLLLFYVFFCLVNFLHTTWTRATENSCIRTEHIDSNAQCSSLPVLLCKQHRNTPFYLLLTSSTNRHSNQTKRKSEMWALFRTLIFTCSVLTSSES